MKINIKNNCSLESSKLNPHMKKFFTANKKIWKNTQCSQYHTERANVILIEGYLGAAGPNYLMRTGAIAKAIEEKRGYVPVVLVNDDIAIELYSSFGITNFIKLRNVKTTIGQKLKCFYKTIMFLFTNPTMKDLIQLEYKGINIGSKVYDELLHGKNIYTVNKINLHCLRILYNSFLILEKYKNVFQSYRVKTLVATHDMYMQYGLLVVSSVINKTPVVLTTDSELSLIKNSKDIFMHQRWHNSINNILLRCNNEKLIQQAKEDLNRRFEGKADLLSRQAFKSKKHYGKDELKEILNIKNDYPIAYIFAHVFIDAPHCSEMNIYRDYYDWLLDTIQICDKIDKVNWIIKTHPSGDVYGETNYLDKMLADTINKNMYCLPDDFSTASLIESADIVITCQGTVGIEMSCMGIPVIVCGRPFYSGFGFTLDMKNKEDYYEHLRKIKTIRRLNTAQIQKAQAVYGAWKKTEISDDIIITDEVLKKVWGYEGKQDINRAFVLAAKNMLHTSPREMNVYKRIKNMLS